MRRVHLKIAVALAALLMAGASVGGVQAQDQEPDRRPQQAFVCIDGMDGGSSQRGFEGCFEPVGVQFQSDREEAARPGRRSEPTVEVAVGIPIEDAEPLVEAHRRGATMDLELSLVSSDDGETAFVGGWHVYPKSLIWVWCEIGVFECKPLPSAPEPPTDPEDGVVLMYVVFVLVI